MVSGLPPAGLKPSIQKENQKEVIIKIDSVPENGLYLETPAGRRLKPNTEILILNHRVSKKDICIRTNSLGYRNPEIGPKTRTRILFLGDSITLGDYLEEDKTFVSLVAALSSSTDRPIETINAGVGAIGLQNEYSILMETGLSTLPDIVVIGFYLNDFGPSPGIRIISPPTVFHKSRLLQYLFQYFSFFMAKVGADYRGTPPAENAAIRKEVLRYFPPGPGIPLKDKPAFNSAIHQNIRDWGKAWSKSAWKKIYLLLKEFGYQAEKNRFKLYIVIFPVRLQVESEFIYAYPQAQLKNIARELDIAVLDLLPILREVFKEGREPLFFDHCHHTAYGNKIIAQSILKFLRSRQNRASTYNTAH
ncbi:MAG: SGNH/GDSL hydrolase family protein [Candidatus Omnitrophica bacterium]|nr:SGNH/GDSL hydrolase family protein [Candidatus Omnitrophota bacterium]